MTSDFVYLEARFTLGSFFFLPRLHYQIRFNPQLTERQVPPEALRGIMAHELAHTDYFHRRHRIALVGLVRLVSTSYRVRFERRADLEAIDLGYAQGLMLYRLWLYQNVPANRVSEKKRDYFGPDEIDAIERARTEHPDIMPTLRRCVPLNLGQLNRELSDPAHACSATNH